VRDHRCSRQPAGRKLRCDNPSAYGRIEAARAARRFPAILKLLREGELRLTADGAASQANSVWT
jgi:hypothetical protein